MQMVCSQMISQQKDDIKISEFNKSNNMVCGVYLTIVGVYLLS